MARTLAATRYNLNTQGAPKVMEFVNAGRRMPQMQKEIQAGH